MGPGTRAAASRKRTNDSNAPPPSNKRLRATQPQQQASETSLQDGPADQPITPVENTESLATELEVLRAYKRQAEAKELEMARELENLQETKRQQSAEVRTLKDAHEEAQKAARTYLSESMDLREKVEAYRIAEQSRGENRERLEELEGEHEKIQDLGGLDKICKNLEYYEELGDIEDLRDLHDQLDDEFGGIENFKEDLLQLEDLGGLDEIRETHDQLRHLGGLALLREEREYDKERLEELEQECERLGEIQGALRAVEAQRDHARLERDEAKRREGTIAALREDLHSERQALYELRSSRPIPAQESGDEDQPEPNNHTDAELGLPWVSSVCEVAKANIKKQMTKAPSSVRMNPAPWFHIGTCPTIDVFCHIFRLATPKKSFKIAATVKIAATELDRALGGPVENSSIAVGTVVLVGDVNVYWDPKTLTFRMSGTFGQSLTTQHDNDDMRSSYVNEH
ncbi:hypothetical protein D6C91_05400 [Aureobasidium pullulans]|uniref:Uncharacterized protein n=1 Tax=Aureobasidium pullulans TaxID=5580 RepID=A0A4S9T5F9_AURPU|nr:hypothetical protein D6C91_05400 [Aureobasidium pullulans]